MQAPTTSTMRLASRMLLAGAAAMAAFFIFQATPALGVPQAQVYIGDQPGTPDIRRFDLRYFRPNDVQAPTASAGTINLLLDGRPVIAYCVQVGNPLNRGTVTSDVFPVDAPSADDRAIQWILQHQTPAGPVTPDKQQEAAVAQVAIWVLRGQLRAVNPTDDATVNAAAAALIVSARAQSATPATLSLTGTSGPAGSRTATVEVTARPGAAVALSITAGPGTLSSGSVTAGANGRATVTVSSPGTGTTVSATTAGDGTLIEIDPADGSQNTVIAGGSQLPVSVTVKEATVVSQTTTPLVVIQARGSLRLTKTAPARARSGAQVRYTITVRNSSKVAVRNVRLLDRIPGGMSFSRASNGGVLQNGRVRWQLGTLRAGQARSVQVWLQANATTTGDRTNEATVSATNVRTMRARVTTVFQAVRRPVRVAVTG